MLCTVAASLPAVLLPAGACGPLPHDEGAVKVFFGADRLTGIQGRCLGEAMVRELVPPACSGGRQTNMGLITNLSKDQKRNWVAA